MSESSRLQRLFLYHVWACAPFALAWVIWPHVVGVTQDPRDILNLRIVVSAATLYLLARTWLTYRPLGRVPWEYVWPVADIALISIALLFKGSPQQSALMLLYLFPIAQAAMTLDLTWSLLISALAAAAFLGASGLEGLAGLQKVHSAFRLFFLMLVASLLTNLGRELARAHRELALAAYKSELAAEMHDGIQHFLVAIATRLELARALIPTDPLEAANAAVDQCELARQASDELRVMVRRLRSPLLEKEGLPEALRQYITLFGERTSIAAELHVIGDQMRLAPRTEHVVLRIVQEALNNIAKHARAARVQVTLEFERLAARCRVRDDGVGFDPATLPAEPGLASGYGMETMHHRAAEVGGSCEVRSKPGEGTEVVVTVPCVPA